MTALSGIHELKVTVRESWPLTIVPPVPNSQTAHWQQTNLKTNKNSAPTLFVVPPFNVTEMRHFKNHQNDGPSWLKLKIALIILAAKMDQWWSL